jgi:arylsulfatase A-like enzyme
MKPARMKILLIVTTIAASATALLLAADVVHAAAKPNILYILADDLGYNDVGFNGCKEIKTPNLDKLAHDGTILKSFYGQPLCSTSRASLLTGRYPCHTGIYGVGGENKGSNFGLPLEERTLAQALKEAGYETAIVGKWHLGDATDAYLPTHRGFDHQYGLHLGNIDYFTHIRLRKLDWWRDDKPCNDQGYSTHLLTKEACRLIQEKDPNKPLFLYLAFNAVHFPFQAPDNYLKLYPNLKGNRQIYAGMLAAMDEGIGQVLAALDAKGIRDNTIILFSSDNGGWGPCDNSPLRGYKGSMYEGGERVCAFADWPGHIPSQATNNDVLHEVDWYPTLIKLAGGSLEQKRPLDGGDIWPVLTQRAKSPHFDEVTLCGTDRGDLAIRMGDWKLIIWTDEKYKNKTPELYNLAKDIGEKHDLAATNPEKVKQLKAKYDEVMRDAAPCLTGVAPGTKIMNRNKEKDEEVQ